ncbi:MAG: hypothetical protein WA047_06660 [Phenylobacterium sp.]|uniref:hypothetical protein n=1 Tax=Phenylobacterium sp. TaxID=1871053 RepID=UPI003BB5093F
MSTRAKFRCHAVTDFGPNMGKEVTLGVVYAPNGVNPEDRNFTKATPSGEIKMRIDNPEAAVQFVPGQAYYVEFSPADAT